jgi:hypothetical protein
MSRMSWPAVPGSERFALLSAPGRVAAVATVAGLLALRRRWWQLAAFTAAVVLPEVLIGLLKGIYDRPRPPGSLVIKRHAEGRQRAA